ncbi:MAG: ATP-binding protein [Aggregatilineales bacterium]
MPLRRRLLVYLLALAVVPTFLVTLTAYGITNNNLVEIERANLAESAASAVRLLEDIETNLANTTLDYANWDDLHAQAATDTPDPDWIGTYLDPASTLSLATTFSLEIIGIYNVNGRLNYAVGNAQAVVAQLGERLPSLRQSEQPLTELLSIDGDIYLVALNAIRKGDGSDPNGVLIAGRQLRPQDAEKFRALLGAEVAFYNGTKLIAATEGFTPSSDPQHLRAAAHGDVVLDQSHSAAAFIYKPIPLEYSAEYLVIALQRSRQAVLAAQQSALQSLLIWLSIVSVAAVLTATALGRPIVGTLAQMVASADQIAAGDYTRRMPLPKRYDELYQMANAFNQMTERLVRNIELLHSQARELNAKNAELMQANAAANQAVRTERDFIASMSHELRTPLTAIIGYSDMLLMGMFGTLSEHQLQRLQIIRDNGTRLLSLINDLLDLSRIQAGKLSLNIAPFAPAALLERTALELSVLAQKKGLRFVREIDPNLPPQLLGDEKRLQQIITNLLGNAFKFTREGEVRLRAHANFSVQMWTLSVSDTGEGIPPEALDTIFEKYQQIQSDMQRGVTGTGLGLPITRDLVELMDGVITVKSTVGKGSTFTISLPMIIPQTLDAMLSATKVQ